jgi:hypothetical protein
MYYILGIRNVDRHFKREILLYQLQRQEMLHEINPISHRMNLMEVNGENSGRGLFQTTSKDSFKDCQNGRFHVPLSNHVPRE